MCLHPTASGMSRPSGLLTVPLRTKQKWRWAPRHSTWCNRKGSSCCSRERLHRRHRQRAWSTQSLDRPRFPRCARPPCCHRRLQRWQCTCSFRWPVGRTQNQSLRLGRCIPMPERSSCFGSGHLWFRQRGSRQMHTTSSNQRRPG